MVCKVLGLGRSTFYNCKKNPATKKEKDTLALQKKARELFEENYSEYGRVRLHKALMLQALREAHDEYKPEEGLIFHSDRGVQYASNEYKAQLKEYGMIQSMSRSGTPQDNAAMESFWATVKIGCVEGRVFRTKEEAISTVFQYVFGFYNTRRYHSANDYGPPTVARKMSIVSLA